ncbi:DUF4271 domain-containing protein [Ichthyenterobacterium sp. W332]|uniref:DUF4271 domain-containing protein n=1 Tax=Microcosmobacter mediterraneus TaxID=3075607 RepID=A0ABU2YPA5_9FLAO|nr:DUF4271 domain-containing protein [Ichthyenterobacterium sp. W332]MDT0559667.1 DUF4271 domain-containing protein [Ichthyenterobacterium sp. W332]
MLREVISYDWLTGFLILGLVAITVSKMVYTSRFFDFLGLIGNSKYLKIYSRDQKFIDSFDSLLFINLTLTIATFSFLAYNSIVAPLEFNLALFLKLVFAIAAIVLIKVLIERLIGSLFDIDEVVDAYLFQKTSFKNFTGFILLPINALLLFSVSLNSVVVFSVIGLIVIINLIGFISSFKTYQKLLLNNLFYFILYLCALEIGPYVILYKVFIEYNA